MKTTKKIETMTQSQKIEVANLRIKHGIDVSHLGCEITVVEHGHGVMFQLYNPEIKSIKIYTIGKRGGIR